MKPLFIFFLLGSTRNPKPPFTLCIYAFFVFSFSQAGLATSTLVVFTGYVRFSLSPLLFYSG